MGFGFQPYKATLHLGFNFTGFNFTFNFKSTFHIQRSTFNIQQTLQNVTIPPGDTHKGHPQQPYAVNLKNIIQHCTNTDPRAMSHIQEHPQKDLQRKLNHYHDLFHFLDLAVPASLHWNLNLQRTPSQFTEYIRFITPPVEGGKKRSGTKSARMVCFTCLKNRSIKIGLAHFLREYHKKGVKN